jgi:hypothetical protein
MTNALLKILPALVTEALGGSTWIHIIGYIGAGKSVLLQSIVDNATASDNCLLVYSFHPQGMEDETIKEAREIEKSIYLLHKKCQDGILAQKVFIAIHEWRLLFNLASDQGRLRDAILDIFWNSRTWGVVFGVISEDTGRKSIYNEIPRDTSDEMQVKLIVGTRALEIARQTWEVTDPRYLWLLQQNRPCIICRSNSIKLAIVPEIQASKPNK